MSKAPSFYVSQGACVPILDLPASVQDTRYCTHPFSGLCFWAKHFQCAWKSSSVPSQKGNTCQQKFLVHVDKMYFTSLFSERDSFYFFYPKIFFGPITFFYSNERVLSSISAACAIEVYTLSSLGWLSKHHSQIWHSMQAFDCMAIMSHYIQSSYERAVFLSREHKSLNW